jgi:hypothetical protein
MPNASTTTTLPTNQGQKNKDLDKMIDAKKEASRDSAQRAADQERGKFKACPACQAGKMEPVDGGFQCSNNSCGHYEPTDTTSSITPCACAYCAPRK